MNADIVIGIDGGGTHTQALVMDAEGYVLATAYAGGASPRSHVNDAVVAHAGALASQPGVIAIAGTGSNVFGVIEDGRHLYGHEFHHYAPAAARYVSYKAVHSILAGQAAREDTELVTTVLAYWEAADIKALREIGAQGFIADEFARNRHFAEMSPLVTAAAGRGESLACSVCDQIAEDFAVGIKLVGGCFRDTQVRVALIGSVANDVYLKGAIIANLSRASDKQYQVVTPAFSGAHGAALMAWKLAGYETGNIIL